MPHTTVDVDLIFGPDEYADYLREQAEEGWFRVGEDEGDLGEMLSNRLASGPDGTT